VATPGRNRIVNRRSSLVGGDTRTPRPPAEQSIGVTPRRKAPYIATPKNKQSFVNLPELDISRLRLGDQSDAREDEEHEHLRHASSAREDGEAIRLVREWAALSRLKAQTERTKHTGGAWRTTLPLLPAQLHSIATSAHPMHSMQRKRVMTSVAASKTTMLEEYKHELEIRRACSCIPFWGSLMPQQQHNIVSNATIEHYGAEVRTYPAIRAGYRRLGL
jgi:hypothetical protein